jgi:RNA polymerase sigma factor (sigma-70 family)
MPAKEHSDAELVSQSLTGDRDAFGRIVERYQTLICSVTYSATGSLGQSEDLSQETFITAWKQLSKLNEPAKLRPWLCGIARNLIHSTFRRQGREPSHAAESLENTAEFPTLESSPPEQAIGREEEAILWRSLERIPEIYREPLVLFYREHRSVEQVAGALELSEDAVKQRLSRGRKLLHEQVLAFVEGALERTNPGKAFTLGVLVALPALTISAKAASLGATAAKGSATAKVAAATGLLGAFLSPLLAFFGLWIGYRMNMDAARFDGERSYAKNFYFKLTGCIVGFGIVYVPLMIWSKSLLTSNPSLFVGLILGLALAYFSAIFFISRSAMRDRRNLLAQLTAAEWATKPIRSVWEYRSKFELLGLPFIHVRIGERLGAPIKAWIALGDCAFGVLFAFGGFAVAPVSIGGCAIGLLPFGGMAMGLLAFGGISLGVWSFGGFALGWQAFGGCAMAWNASWGGVSVARHYALGGVAQAAQANNGIAQTFIQSHSFFRISEMVFPYVAWLNLIWLVPMVAWWGVVRRAKTTATVLALMFISAVAFLP